MKNNIRKGALLQSFENITLINVLLLLSDYPEKEFTGTEIAKKLKKNRMTVFLSLLKLEREGIIKKEKKGRIYLYRIIQGNPIVKQLKILKNILILNSLITKLKNFSKKIILYGSAGRGEDIAGSDIDLLVITNNIEGVKKQIQKFKLKRKIEAKIFTPTEFINLKTKDNIFYEEINSGITLYEGE